MVRKVKTEQAVGMALAHDVTRIIPGEFKGPAFRRGHIIREEDIPALLDMGKEHVYILELAEGEVHEEEAARRIAKTISSAGLELTEPREGRVNLLAKASGLLKINAPLLEQVNLLGEIAISTLHSNTVCYPGLMVAGVKIVPLFTTEALLGRLEKLCSEKIVKLVPFQKKTIGVVIIGNEVFKGRIKDKFREVLERKLGALGQAISWQAIVPDEAEGIAGALGEMRSKGSEIIFACGGMSVDPDDVTVKGISGAGVKIVSYGAPVMPGSMFLYGLWDSIPVLGLPACVIHDPATILDIVLPRVLAGETLCREDIVRLGYGGLCQRCSKCTFPVCPFGKG